VNSRRAWLVYAIGAVAYIVAVLQRTSLSVASVDATERFEVQATALSTLSVVQLIVYASLQIPVGVLLDRVGPRFLVSCGATLMMLGQITLAVAPTITVAIIGRILVGAGDAMTFISVTRLLASWFSGRTLPLLTQLLGTLGGVGQLLSAVPLVFVLHQFGWQSAFLGAASISLIAAVLVVSFVRNAPVGAVLHEPVAWKAAYGHIRDALARPGTQLAFWAHFVSGSPGTMFAMLWGFPFLSIGLGYGPVGAALFLTGMILSAMVGGPILGILSARYPHRRSNIILGIVASMAIAWVLVLAWPGQPPLWSVVLLVVTLAIGGPGSLIGFDFARSFNPARSLGSASGVVNVGGFLAAFLMMFFVGIVLDALARASGGTVGPAELYSLESFRIAFLVQVPVIGTGVVYLLITRSRTRAKLHEEEGIRVAPLWVSLARAWRRKSSVT
jgi:sugar phosphate permease